MLIFFSSGCAFKSIHRFKNIPYLKADSLSGKKTQTLNVFSSKHTSGLQPVFIFVHGGNWNSGRKGLYSFFGTRMARKGIVSVIIDYPKSPAAGFEEMTEAVTAGVKWVSKNISRYGGDSAKIFISGHSAGGHLAALAGINKKYFKKAGIENPLKGIVLIDAAGPDMYSYMNEEGYEYQTYLNTFTTDPEKWKEASPIRFLHDSMPAMLIYRGEKTYPSIREGTEKFITALKAFVPLPDYHILKGKKHIPMILQFFNSSNKRYGEIIRFMKRQ